MRNKPGYWDEERRWRVRKRVHVDDLETVLNNLEEKHTIRHIVEHGYRFTVVASRMVKVWREM
jgi:thymidylate synthase